MITRNDYAGPVTKSAEAMFARAERRTNPQNTSPTDRTAKAKPRSPSALRQVIEALGLSTTIIRRWEEAGVVAFERRGGRVVVDETTRETLATVVELRRAGFTVKEITWISDAGPPSVPAMRQALQARLTHRDASRARSITDAIAAGCSRG